MNKTKFRKRTRIVINAAFALLAVAAMVMTVYLGATPRQFDLQIGDISPYDIAAPRDIADEAETVRRALVEMSHVQNVMIRSEEKSDASHAMIQSLLAQVQEKRDALYKEVIIQVEPEPGSSESPGEGTQNPPEERPRRPDSQEIGLAVSSLISSIDQSLDVVLPSGDVDAMVRMDEDRFQHLTATLLTETGAIVAKTLDAAGLRLSISEAVTRLDETLEYYTDDAALTGRLLALLLQPNVEFNEEATEKARKAAYDRVMSNPVMVNRGVRILSQGEVISPEVKVMLDELNLTVGADFDWIRFGSTVALVVMVGVVAIFYFSRYAPDLMVATSRNILALILAVLLPLVMSAYLARDYPLASPIYFAAVVVTAYFGLRTSIFLSSMLIILTMPMTSFDPTFPIVAILGCTIAALFTKGTNRHDNYARIILATSFVNALSTMLVGLLQKESWGLITSNMTQATVSGGLSVIIGIGIMPLFELIFNTVSPLRLIELSQPGHPLMKRLFVEAPGTSQHSMMVANLADTAAEAIGANSMIARVGSYFHDVGKLEAPLMFTENQSRDNPHDRLSPLESAKIIIRHPEDSMALGRKYRLPAPLLRIAHEHHGTTRLQYFLDKANAEAEARGEEPPPVGAFCYRTPLPSSRESAIVMLADSVEAAMRSEGVRTFEDADRLISQIIRGKIEQDQLRYSGLSFADIETISQSFLQVYAGHFHERVPYRPAARSQERPAIDRGEVHE
ncbi:MAG TPA: HDIG domain-containing protein [Clostridia bacterium]|nr:HDIG domain-containing protein [Clostridia bacterium]